MFERIVTTGFALVLLTAPGSAASSDDAKLTAALQKVLDRYLVTRSKPEHISAISLSISLKDESSNINLAAGTTKYRNAGQKATPADLFEIGSNHESLHVGRDPSSRGCRKTLDFGHSRKVASPIPRVEDGHDSPVARHDQPDPGI